MNPQQASDGAGKTRGSSNERSSSRREGEAVEQVEEKVRNIAEDSKKAGSDQIGRVGAAVHTAAHELEKDLPRVARYIDSAAESLQNASSNLRERSIEELATGFSDFARRQPAAAFAASVLGGFALARFLKSSGQGRENDSAIGEENDISRL